MNEENLKLYVAKLVNQQQIADFLYKLNDYVPTIPDNVTSYYLKKSGFETDDIRLIRLVSLAAQKFVSDLANDALQYHKMKIANNKEGQNAKYTLTVEDLSAAASEYGIQIKKPSYYQ